MSAERYASTRRPGFRIILGGWCGLGLVALLNLYHSRGGLDLLDVVLAILTPVAAGLLCHGLTLSHARSEDTAATVAQERARFARDLHDLLGYSLSAITLKSELARRMVGSDEIRARRELAEVLEISRQALRDVREVSQRYPDLSLTEAVASVRGVLDSAGVASDIEVHAGALPTEVSTVMATVLREGVANLLRHSQARRCRIRVRRAGGNISLALSNDGLRGSPDPTRRRRNGLDNLAARMADAGGELSVYTDRDGWFHLLAVCPVPETPAATGYPVDEREKEKEDEEMEDCGQPCMHSMP
ncbi:histidine kinase [Streptomyces sp. NPDC091212]|uniref:sensor histidine kinase n=1 Tax=Streptomyces sp. NPDC091212 TaxID=3155191 RepID=UPI003444E7B7